MVKNHNKGQMFKHTEANLKITQAGSHAIITIYRTVSDTVSAGQGKKNSITYRLINQIFLSFILSH